MMKLALDSLRQSSRPFWIWTNIFLDSQRRFISSEKFLSSVCLEQLCLFLPLLVAAVNTLNFDGRPHVKFHRRTFYSLNIFSSENQSQNHQKKLRLRLLQIDNPFAIFAPLQLSSRTTSLFMSYDPCFLSKYVSNNC